MSLKSQTSALVALIAGLIGAAAELQAVGGVRPEHDQKFASLRVALDQANDAAQTLDQAAEAGAPMLPDAAALQALTDKVAHVADVLELHGTSLDHMADQIAAKA